MHVNELTFPTIEYGLPIADGGGGPHPFDIKEKFQYLGHIYNKD